jgi:tRNA-specific 2-thiouridylase
LARTLFPLGDKTKAEARALARERGCVNAAKKDSEDICFVTSGDYGDFLEALRGAPYPPGDIIGPDGAVVGRHRGLPRYTLGQRRGVGCACNRPLYVTGKRIADNTLLLGPESCLYSKRLAAREINLIAAPSLERPVRVSCRTRYMQKEMPALAWQSAADELQVEFDEPVRAVTAGQSVVLYDGDVVLGGGVIAVAETI